MIVYTDVSHRHDDGTNLVHVGLVVTDGARVFSAAVSIDFIQGECPEETAIRWVKRVFPGAFAYYTDWLNTKEGSFMYRRHERIKSCHKLARAKLHSPQSLIDILVKKQIRIDAQAESDVVCIGADSSGESRCALRNCS